jgi:phospholipid transport system transporter-binding protein
MTMPNATAGELTTASGGACALRGAVTFDTVQRLWKQSSRLLGSVAAGGAITLDLSGVEHVDSAGLALLVDWKSQAIAQGSQLLFQAVPPRLTAIARISDAEPLLQNP